MKISKNTLWGYLLEEALAFLIRNAGYRLLVDESQDKRELINRHNGLAVIGRGGYHQVDVLGQLEWIPAFTFPIRLFVEAKFRGGKTGIAEARKAVGILSDLRENIAPLREKNVYPQKYHYCFALFSTSGFTKGASTLALAHGVSLIDLSIPHFQPLLSAIRATGNDVISSFGIDTADDELEPTTVAADLRPVDDDALVPEAKRTELVRNIRNVLRRELGTQPEGIPQDIPPYDDELKGALEPLVTATAEYGEVFIGMANGPFMLFLHADNPEAFLRFSRARPKHRIDIRWSPRLDRGRTWWIQPSAEEYGPLPAYRLEFSLPKILLDWMIGQPGEPRESALNVKRRFLSQILIYRVTDQDELFRLEFNTLDVAQQRRAGGN